MKRYAAEMALKGAKLTTTAKRSFSSSELVSKSSSSGSSGKEKSIKHNKVYKLLIVGLGNPGLEYENTRHNIGFRAIDTFLRMCGYHMQAHEHGVVSPTFKRYKSLNGEVCQAEWPDEKQKYDLIDRISERRREKTKIKGVTTPVEVTVLRPHTYMNLSGTAVRQALELFRISPPHTKKLGTSPRHRVLVVHDDVTVPFGSCRFVRQGGPGGQNGVEDVIKRLHTDKFSRLKIGIGNRNGDRLKASLDRYVLGKFSQSEEEDMPLLMAMTADFLRMFVHRQMEESTSIANGCDIAKYRGWARV